jgi:hypothetical protein
MWRWGDKEISFETLTYIFGFKFNLLDILCIIKDIGGITQKIREYLGRFVILGFSMS